jgi:predicted nucleic acid-binding protein
LVIVDTSGLLASISPDQREHEACAEILNNARGLVTSPFVLAELDHLLTTRFGHAVSVRAFSELAESGIDLAVVTWDDTVLALDVIRQYVDLGISLTDASLVVLAKRYKTDEILTLDQRHFRAISGLDGRHFKLFPFDI